jgi:alkylation response protein AidB-like acyl-CoA dehydrogenase
MDFTLSPDQQLLRDTARRLFDKECAPAVVRAHIDDPAAFAPLWKHLREYVALGSGPATDCCLFLEEAGHAAAPGPLLAALLFTALTGGDGSVVGTVSLVGDSTMPFTLEIDRVEQVAFVRADGAVAIVDAPVAARLVTTVDFSRRLFMPDVDTSSLAYTPQPAEAFVAWRDRAHACLAAEMVGTARRIFEMTLQYAKERHQFGVPIGSFQAIQHKLAEMSLALERATAAVQYAAMTVDAADAERTRACHVAKAAAGHAARRILKDGIQIHGGIGYTWEHDLHLFLRRATGDEYLLGTTGWHHDRLADLLFG